MQAMNLKGLSTVGAIALATVLAFASASFACTEYKGRVTITATGAGASGSGTRTGNGADGSGPAGFAQGNYGYCESFPTGNQPIMLQGTTRTFDIAVTPGPASGCGAGMSVANFSWKVFWARDSLAGDDVVTCHTIRLAASAQPVKQLGSLTTTSGSGSGSYALGLGDIGPGNICIDYDPAGPPPPNNVIAPMLSINYTLTI